MNNTSSKCFILEDKRYLDIISPKKTMGKDKLAATSLISSTSHNQTAAFKELHKDKHRDSVIKLQKK